MVRTISFHLSSDSKWNGQIENRNRNRMKKFQLSLLFGDLRCVRVHVIVSRWSSHAIRVHLLNDPFHCIRILSTFPEWDECAVEVDGESKQDSQQTLAWPEGRLSEFKHFSLRMKWNDDESEVTRVLLRFDELISWISRFVRVLVFFHFEINLLHTKESWRLCRHSYSICRAWNARRRFKDSIFAMIRFAKLERCLRERRPYINNKSVSCYCHQFSYIVYQFQLNFATNVEGSCWQQMRRVARQWTRAKRKCEERKSGSKKKWKWGEVNDGTNFLSLNKSILVGREGKVFHHFLQGLRDCVTSIE